MIFKGIQFRRSLTRIFREQTPKTNYLDVEGKRISDYYVVIFEVRGIMDFEAARGKTPPKGFEFWRDMNDNECHRGEGKWYTRQLPHHGHSRTNLVYGPIISVMGERRRRVWAALNGRVYTGSLRPRG